MSDINFIGSDKEATKPKKPGKEDQPTVRWTDPGEFNGVPGPGKKKVEDIFAETEPSLAPKRFPPKDAAPVSQPEIIINNQPKILGLFSIVKDALFKKSSSAPNNGQFKKGKEELNNYHEVLTGEAEKRKNGWQEEKQPKANEKSYFKRDLWQAPNVIKTNLIETEEANALEWKEKINQLLIGIISACLLVVLVYLGLEIKGTIAIQKNQETIQAIQDIKMQIQSLKSGLGDIETFQKKLEVAKNLLDNHIYWTNFFKFWEDNLLKVVYFSGGFSGDTKGNYTFSAITGSYADAANQIKILRTITGPNNSRLISGLEVNRASYSIGQQGVSQEQAEKNSAQAIVTFDLGVKMDPSIFYYQE